MRDIRLHRFSPLNTIYHDRELLDARQKIGVGPNNDTLYTSAYLDLADGPFVLRTPDFKDRYYTFQFAEADSATKIAVGQRTHGAQLPPLFIHSEDFSGDVPAGMLSVPVSTRYVLIIGRTLVSGAADLDAVHALQDRVLLTRFSPDGEVVPPTRAAPPPPPPLEGELAFLEQLGSVLEEWEPRAAEAESLQSFAGIGLQPGRGFEAERLGACEQEEVIEGLQDGKEIVRRKSLNLGQNVSGWTINYSGGRFGSDYLLRAGVAKDQIFVSLPEEAIYPIARVDAAGRPLNGKNSYRIVMEEGELPPVGAFWSITVYDDMGHMVPNPIDRYSLGDRTSGLVAAEDGSVKIVLSNSKPTEPHVNWLPVPKEPFYLMMRLYIPGKEIRNGSWPLPKIEQFKVGQE